MSLPESAVYPLCQSCVSFTVTAEAEPSVLSRVIEYFVVLNILPDSVRLRRYTDGHLEIVVKARGLDQERVEVIAHKLRQIVTVRQVFTEVFAVGGDINHYRERQQLAAQ